MTETKIFIDPVHLPEHLKQYCGDFTTDHADPEDRAMVIDRHGNLHLTDGERFWQAQDTHGIIDAEYCFDGPNNVECYVTLRIKFTDGSLSGVETVFDEIAAPMCHIQERHQRQKFFAEKAQERTEELFSILDQIFSGILAGTADRNERRTRLH